MLIRCPKNQSPKYQTIQSHGLIGPDLTQVDDMNWKTFLHDKHCYQSWYTQPNGPVDGSYSSGSVQQDICVHGKTLLCSALSFVSQKFPKYCVWNSSFLFFYTKPCSPSPLYTSLLQAIGGLMFWALCLQVIYKIHSRPHHPHPYLGWWKIWVSSAISQRLQCSVGNTKMFRGVHKSTHFS